MSKNKQKGLDKLGETNENDKSIRTVISTQMVFDTETGPRWFAVMKVPVDDKQATLAPDKQTPIPYAIVDTEAWNELIKLGLNPLLSFRDGSVKVWCKKPRRYYPLMSLIADATTDDVVSVANGNPLDLRRCNIIVDRKPEERFRDYLDPSSLAGMLVQYKMGSVYGGSDD